jgi:hypothetical protein
MVDMRSEGEVHYDGFEYNWYFRRHQWRPEPGLFNAGGWVRRRRWVRLMVRPAHPIDPGEDGYPRSPVITSPSTRYSIIPDNSALELEAEKALVWRGDAEDWKRCHHLMVRLNRDGTKLDLWRQWLGVSPRVRQRKVWTEDDYVTPFEECNSVERTPVLEGVQREDLTAVVRDHVSAALCISILHRAYHSQAEDLIRLFIYPESRVEFVEILSAAGISDLPSAFGDLGVEFWSYTRALSDVVVP